MTTHRENAKALAVVLDAPGSIGLDHLALDAPGPDDVVVDIAVSGISTGTEKLLVTGEMPPFPGMGYPLVPGYESVGRVSRAGGGLAEGATVFVPGARCFGPVRGLFGATASQLVVPAARVVPVDAALGDDAVLIALAATAYHALHDRGALALPDLIIGHGVLGRLIARLSVALGGAPVVHEIVAARRAGALGYTVEGPGEGSLKGLARVLDASGADAAVDMAVSRLAKGGEIVLAGFYAKPVSFAFPPAFIAEARLRISAEFTPADLAAVTAMASDGRLRLDGLITHSAPAADAARAYRTAFDDPSCLKMTIDWRAS
ncbi:MAG: chlorophyll synthesis pathway protein BchC [Pseudomonadota bacterium]